MNVHASPLVPAGLLPVVQPDMSLSVLLAALAPHEGKTLALAYEDGRRVQSGYHVTEVKAASFVTLDCGGNPDAWQETVLQVEDIPAAQGKAAMTAGKFRSIIAKVDRKVRLNDEARLTIEVSRRGEPMQVYDVAGVAVEGDEAVIRLGARPAICKPRHRAEQEQAAACCAPSAGSACCA